MHPLLSSKSYVLIGGVMLINQQLMEGVQTFLGDFLVTATDGGDNYRGKRHCCFIALGWFTRLFPYWFTYVQD